MEELKKFTINISNINYDIEMKFEPLDIAKLHGKKLSMNIKSPDKEFIYEFHFGLRYLTGIRNLENFMETKSSEITKDLIRCGKYEDKLIKISCSGINITNHNQN